MLEWMNLDPLLQYSLGCPPSQDASHHEDYEPFLVGDPYKPSFATVTGRGDNPKYSDHEIVHQKYFLFFFKLTAAAF